MRPTRLLLPFLLAVVASVPATGHAAGYRKYASTACPYSIQYPTTWSARSGARHDTFLFESSPRRFAQVLVSCAYSKNNRSIKHLTVAVAHAYAKRGYGLATPQYKGNLLGLFFGQTTYKSGGKIYGERLHVSTLIYRGRAWVMALAGDSADFGASERVYDHFLATFTPRK